MSIEELLRVYENNRNQGLTLNINCGHLRGIGKTEALRTLIRQRSRNIRVILLLPSSSYQRYWLEETRNYNLVTFCQNQHGYPAHPPLTQSLNHIYADEVHNAENIVMSWHANNVSFIAGFYSTVYTLKPRAVIKGND